MTTMEVAKLLVGRLAQHDIRIVFAESCTGGLICAELAQIPGVSQWLCGSAVTYRCDTKVRWLGVSADDIRQHTAVSSQVAIEMAQGVLEKTPEASLSASITGHLGPDAPTEFDGVVFVGIAWRVSQEGLQVEVSRHQLNHSARAARQTEATELVLKLALAQVSS